MKHGSRGETRFVRGISHRILEVETLASKKSEKKRSCPCEQKKIEMDRRNRAVKRSYARAGAQARVVCAICLENVVKDCVPLPCTTLCDHIFHQGCWNQYCRSVLHVDDDLEVTVNDLIQTFIVAHAGPPCPMCRRKLPLLDRLAYAVQDDNCMAPIQGLRGITTDLTLQLAKTKSSAN